MCGHEISYFSPKTIPSSQRLFMVRYLQPVQRTLYCLQIIICLCTVFKQFSVLCIIFRLCSNWELSTDNLLYRALPAKKYTLIYPVIMRANLKLPPPPPVHRSQKTYVLFRLSNENVAAIIPAMHATYTNHYNRGIR
jgi:hypothetical protein